MERLSRIGPLSSRGHGHCMVDSMGPARRIGIDSFAGPNCSWNSRTILGCPSTFLVRTHSELRCSPHGLLHGWQVALQAAMEHSEFIATSVLEVNELCNSVADGRKRI